MKYTLCDDPHRRCVMMRHDAGSKHDQPRSSSFAPLARPVPGGWLSMPRILVSGILFAVLAPSPAVGQDPWEDPWGPYCFELWISESMARLNGFDGTPEFNSRKPWRINQYGMFLGRDSWSNYEPDRWDQYDRNKYWWIWDHYTAYNPVTGWNDWIWRDAGVELIRTAVPRCIEDMRSGSVPPTPPGGLLVPPAPPGIPAGSSLGLGDIWDDLSPGGWIGTYTRRGNSDIFDAVWTHPQYGTVTATMAVARSGSTVWVRRTDTSGPQTGRSCNFMGTLSADQRSISGSASCEWAPGPMSWVVSIRGAGPTPPNGSGYNPVGGFACFGGASYPQSWTSAANCDGRGCYVGVLGRDACLAIGAERGATEVVHGNPGARRPNECWIQNSCARQVESQDFTVFRYGGGGPPPPPPVASYSSVGAVACFGGADYPPDWANEAICGAWGCNFGALPLQSCLVVATQKGALLVIHGNEGGARSNECWLQSSCAELRPHESFTAYRPAVGMLPISMEVWVGVRQVPACAVPPQR
jgi:hypothetical protein